MYPTRQLEQQPSFTYLSHHPTNPDPNPYSYLSYQQSAPFAEPAIHPPGTDPFANSATNLLPHVPIEGQTLYYADPNAASGTWVAAQANSDVFESESLVSSSLNSSRSNCWTSQPLVNDVTKSIPAQGQVIQPMRCGISNIDCNSKEVFEKHISGKKHQQNTQNQLNPTAVTLQKSCSTINNMHILSQELEIKKQKLLNGGAAVDSMRFCTICNVACKDQQVFNKHLSGKKHAAQAGLIPLDGVGQYFAAIKGRNNSFWSRGPKKTKLVQSVWCEVCKINCNSSDVYVKHLQGKKHQKNLDTLEKAESSTSAPASLAAPSATNSMIIGPLEKTKTVDEQKLQKRMVRSLLTVEDLETKKRKVVEGGAAAGAVRVCTLCNVVCNSQTVFAYHLAGQKHAAMVKKQSEEAPKNIVPFTSIL